MSALVKLLSCRISTNFRFTHQNGHFLILGFNFESVFILILFVEIFVCSVDRGPFETEIFFFRPSFLIAHAEFFIEVL